MILNLGVIIILQSYGWGGRIGGGEMEIPVLEQIK